MAPAWWVCAQRLLTLGMGWGCGHLAHYGPFPLPLDEGTGPVCSRARLATYLGMFFKPLKVSEANSRLSITLWMPALLCPSSHLQWSSPDGWSQEDS